MNVIVWTTDLTETPFHIIQLFTQLILTNYSLFLFNLNQHVLVYLRRSYIYIHIVLIRTIFSKNYNSYHPTYLLLAINKKTMPLAYFKMICFSTIIVLNFAIAYVVLITLGLQESRFGIFSTHLLLFNTIRLAMHINDN